MDEATLPGAPLSPGTFTSKPVHFVISHRIGIRKLAGLWVLEGLHDVRRVEGRLRAVDNKYVKRMEDRNHDHLNTEMTSGAEVVVHR